MAKYLLGAERTVLVDLEESLEKILKSLKGSFYLSYRFSRGVLGDFSGERKFCFHWDAWKHHQEKEEQKVLGEEAFLILKIFFWSYEEIKGVSQAGRVERKKKKKALKKNRRYIIFAF